MYDCVITILLNKPVGQIIHIRIKFVEKRSIAEILINWEKSNFHQWINFDKYLSDMSIDKSKLKASSDPKIYDLMLDIDRSFYETNDAITDFVSDTLSTDISNKNFIELRQEIIEYIDTIRILIRAQLNTVSYLLSGVDNEPETVQSDGHFSRKS